MIDPALFTTPANQQGATGTIPSQYNHPAVGPPASFNPLQYNGQATPPPKRFRGKNPSDRMKNRKEFGLVDTKMTLAELDIVRLYNHELPRRDCWGKGPPGASCAIRLTQHEFENLARLRLRNGNPFAATKNKRFRSLGLNSPDRARILEHCHHYEKSMAGKIAGKTGRDVDTIIREIQNHYVH